VVFSGGFLNLGRNATIGRLTSDGQGGGRNNGTGILNAGGPTTIDNVSLFAGTTNLRGPAVTLRNLTMTESQLNLTPAAQAVWDAGDWQLSAATLTNAGHLLVSGDGTAADAGEPPLVENTGTLIRDDADPSTSGQAFTAQVRNRGVLHVANGALDLGSLGEQVDGRTIVDSAGVLGGPGAHYSLAGGRLEGTGTVAGALENSAGTVGPGASPGIVSVDGNYTQGAGGTLEAEVTGPDPGTDYDRLAVSGSATLAGTLDIVTPGTFVPPLRSIYTIVTAGDLSGAFDTVVGAELADRQYAVDYSNDPGRVRLRVPLDDTEGLVAVSNGSLEFTAAGGDVVNSVTLSGPAGGRYSVRDTAAPVAAGAGCVQVDANLVRCAAAGVTQATLELGGANDTGRVLSALPTTLLGGAGADRLTGGTGADTLSAGAGNDRLTGGEGADSLHGGAENDTLDGGPGPDALRGGGGTDTATYAGRTEPVTVTIDDVADDGGSLDGPADARDDVATDVEYLVGGSGDDSLTGSAANNTFNGGPGADRLSGQGGSDRVTYANRTEPLTVTIDDVADDGGVSDGPAGARDDVATDVESLVGGSGDDSLTGSASANSFDGRAGADRFSGLGGVDSVTYGSRSEAVTVTIDDVADDGGVSDGPEGARDDVGTDVENISGGSGDDSLTGSAAANRLIGGAGADRFSGLGGIDTVNYASRTEAVTATIDDVADDGGGADGPDGARDNVGTDIENLVGGRGDDSLTGSSEANRLTGGIGADILRGLEGNDVLVAKDGGADTELDCDGGAADLVTVDDVDPASVDCEQVKP
jgi:Ca2+-binding RTX toxin-like protein